MARISLIKSVAVLLVGCALLISCAAGALYGHPHDEDLRRALTESSDDRQIFDVTEFGAVPNNDKEDNVQAFMDTWVAACRNSDVPAKIVVPKGSFLVGPVVFQGPCKNSNPIIVEVLGTIKATTDISDYSSPEWFLFENINGLLLTGDGTFDGQGPAVWKYNDCKVNRDCIHLPASLRYAYVNNAIVEGVTSLNSKWFHFYTYGCKNFTFEKVKVIAPGNSPNTDGIHLSATSSVNITDVTIATGDDCLAIGQDTHDIFAQNITCGPGHGFSVGSLGKWPWEKSVSRIHLKNCTINGATNGARIKTWGGKTSGTATDIIYEDIIMNNVKNPIVIDQNYGRQGGASKWQISDVQFKNIRGTSISKVSVSLGCSPLFPCVGIELTDIDLTYTGPKFKTTQTDSVCSNAKITSFGSENPPPCNSKLKPTITSYLTGEDE